MANITVTKDMIDKIIPLNDRGHYGGYKGELTKTRYELQE